MTTVLCHDGAAFRVERWGTRETLCVLHKPTGRYAVLKGDALTRFYDAVYQALKHYPGQMDGEGLYAWIWINAGFHRFAN